MYINQTRIQKETSQLILSKKLITLKAIKQLISIYQGKIDFEVNVKSDNYVININKTDSTISLDQIKNEFLDQQIRIDLENDFGNLRDLIVKYAFFPAENNIKNE